MLSTSALLLGLIVAQAPGTETDPAPAPLQIEPLRVVVDPDSDVEPGPSGEGVIEAVDTGEEVPRPLAAEMIHRSPFVPFGLANQHGVEHDAQLYNPYLDPVLPHPNPCSCCVGHPPWHWCHWWFSPGNMIPHLRYYPTLHGYYYARPYHIMHIAHHQRVVSKYGGDPRNPYDNKIFEKVYAELNEERAAKAEQNALELLEPGANPEEPGEDAERKD